MSIYAVGDIQGCYQALASGLEKIRFDPGQDQLWCAGDLVNRGGQSEQTLDLLYSIRRSLKVVLGNHDLYLLRAMYGSMPVRVNADMRSVLTHPNAPKWCDWLRSQPLYHYDQERKVFLVHAGLPHIWTLDMSKAYADEAAKAISAPDNTYFWDNLFGVKPRRLKPSHAGIDRLRAIIHYFTRMRFITAAGKLDLSRTEKPGKPTEGTVELPWYAFPRNDNQDINILFGHWAALEGVLYGGSQVKAVALDTGCVWGGKLTFYNVDTGQVTTSRQKKKKSVG